MAPFPSAYVIPNDIKALVRKEKNSPNSMDMLLKFGSVKSRKDPMKYHLSFSTKLFLEEEASLSRKFDKYHLNNIQIEHFNNDIFRFRISDVRITFHLIKFD